MSIVCSEAPRLRRGIDQDSAVSFLGFGFFLVLWDQWAHAGCLEYMIRTKEMSRDMTKPTKWLCAQRRLRSAGHPPSLIWVFAVRMMKAWTLSYQLSAQQRLWSDWANAQADLSLRWAHSHFVDFVMSRLILYPYVDYICDLLIWTPSVNCNQVEIVSFLFIWSQNIPVA